jgi:hypothetical protein
MITCRVATIVAGSVFLSACVFETVSPYDARSWTTIPPARNDDRVAEALSLLRPQTRIIVTDTTETIVAGRFAGIGDGGILRLSSGVSLRDSVRVPVTSVGTVWEYQGRNTALGAVIGGGLGGLLGMVMAGLSSLVSDRDGEALIWIGVGAGGVTGFVVGHGQENWRPVIRRVR